MLLFQVCLLYSFVQAFFLTLWTLIEAVASPRLTESSIWTIVKSDTIINYRKEPQSMKSFSTGFFRAQ
jgi:hypothetical protein